MSPGPLSTADRTVGPGRHHNAGLPTAPGLFRCERDLNAQTLHSLGFGMAQCYALGIVTVMMPLSKRVSI
jgi:hypothetical protein